MLGWWLPATVWLLHLPVDHDPLGMCFAATPLFVVVGMSVSDFVAIRDSELFRTLWMDHEFDGTNAWLYLLIGNSIPTSNESPESSEQDSDG